MSSDRNADTVNVTAYPADIQNAYRVFAVRCSRCHTLARPLNARISDPEHWVRYVTRMRRNPSSGINPKDADIILSFLLYYTNEVRVEEQERGAAGEPTSVPASSPAPPSTTADAPPVVTVPDSNMPEESTPALSNDTTHGRTP
jgi:hypothetical protein